MTDAAPGSSVDIVRGKYAGLRGKVLTNTPKKVRVQLESASEVLISKESIGHASGEEETTHETTTSTSTKGSNSRAGDTPRTTIKGLVFFEIVLCAALYYQGEASVQFCRSHLDSLHAWISNDPLLETDHLHMLTVVSEATDSVAIWYPSLRPGFLDVELNFADGGRMSLWAREHFFIATQLCVLYIVVVFGLQRFLRSRNHIDIRRVQMWWNLALSIFSFAGMTRTVPHLLSKLHHDGLEHAVCDSASRYGYAGPSALWVWLFIFSKVPELCDTLFIVLAKRPVMFIQWYHHLTVLLYSWYAYANRPSIGIWFVSVNFTVHAIMYLYFALMGKVSMDKSLAKKLAASNEDSTATDQLLARAKKMRAFLSALAPIITLMQVSQMALGVFLHYYSLNLWNMGKTCATTRATWLAGLLMYSSYLVLFSVFAQQRYCSRRAPESTRKLD